MEAITIQYLIFAGFVIGLLYRQYILTKKVNKLSIFANTKANNPLKGYRYVMVEVGSDGATHYSINLDALMNVNSEDFSKLLDTFKDDANSKAM